MNPDLGLAGVLLAYWSSTPVLTIVGSILLGLAIMALAFAAMPRRPANRLRLLTALQVGTVVLWGFLGISLTLCLLQGDQTEYARGILRLAGTSILGALGLAAAVSMALWRRPVRPGAPLPAGSTLPNDPVLLGRWTSVARALGSRLPRVLTLDRGEPMSMVALTRDPTIVVSRGLLEKLEPEEVDLVVAHEIAHVEQGRRLPVFNASLARVLRFDPLVRLLDAATHREREYDADWRAAVALGRPATLAMALLKLTRSGASPRDVIGVDALVGRHGGILSPYPSVGMRIERLLALAEAGRKV